MPDIKRVVCTAFWTDEKVLEFTPEDKYFMLFLLTNTQSTQLGIYKLPIVFAAREMGYSKETVLELFDRFERYDIIKYNKSTQEIAIKNYLKYSIVKGGKPVIDCLFKDEKLIKDKSLLVYIYNALSERTDITNTTVLYYLEHIFNTYINNNTNNNNYINDNDNDNDNDRIVVRYDNESLKPDKLFDFEKAWNKTFELYPKKTGSAVAKQNWLKKVTAASPARREEIAKLIYFATKLYINDFDKQNKSEDKYRFLPKYSVWLEEDCDYWILQYEQLKQGSEAK